MERKQLFSVFSDPCPTLNYFPIYIFGKSITVSLRSWNRKNFLIIFILLILVAGGGSAEPAPRD
jgi:hypothetical protein